MSRAASADLIRRPTAPGGALVLGPACVHLYANRHRR